MNKEDIVNAKNLKEEITLLKIYLEDKHLSTGEQRIICQGFIDISMMTDTMVAMKELIKSEKEEHKK